MSAAVAVRLAHDLSAARPHLERASAHHVLGSRALIDDAVRGQAVFELVADGRVVGAFSIGVYESPSDGRVMHCSAAGGEPGHDLFGAMLEFAEREARDHVDARVMYCETRRPGLARKLKRAGYRIAYICVKEIQQ